ncbi:unnamed protein product [Brassica oleracea var. botrytis]|uniref:Uncharacterized protein n=2 Tax=Brassica oleracea TaxID=3712 RepID=A0A0D3A4V2_BRAOL|nr:PREDICTED: uncharacterized protein LOC106294261 [Brassica oleracea var. oleracea]VDD49108.1 unnamed protein product [Brassica oleracea]
MQRPPKSLLPPHRHAPMEEISFSSSSDPPPLFSCFIALCTLILIYSPDDSLRIFLSPVLLISGALLFSLERLGSTREPLTRPGKSKEGEVKTEETEESDVLFDVYSLSEAKQDSDIRQEFVEWDLRAPLEVIHEAYEEDDDDEDEEEDPTRFRELERYPSLSLCYPESDSDSSSEFTFPEMSSWMSPEKMGYRWEEEEDDGAAGLIEIKLYEEYKKKKMSKQNQTEMDFHAEEEGLIEIDLFP